jgi:hypothetical protein
MLDQNTTTVLTTAITVLGTLGGVVLGVVLSNRYVARQEKFKRNNPIIEEVYTLINQMDNRFNDRLRNPGPYEEDPALERIRTLINLYLPSERAKFKEFINRMKIFYGVVAYETSNKGKVSDPYQISFPYEYNAYHKSLTELQTSLEKLVR